MIRISRYIVFGGLGFALYMWIKTRSEMSFKYLKRKHSTTVISDELQCGPIELTDRYGKLFNTKSLKGQYHVIYFGFTNCPDICPQQLIKISQAIDIAEKNTLEKLIPIFISVDPKRDSVEQLFKYSQENPFHQRLIWLRGDNKEIREICNRYKAYYSAPPDDTDDYLVDHSVFAYLINPDGKLLDVLGMQYDGDEIGETLSYAINEDQHKRGVPITSSFQFYLAQWKLTLFG